MGGVIQVAAMNPKLSPCLGLIVRRGGLTARKAATIEPTIQRRHSPSESIGQPGKKRGRITRLPSRA
jgi:hypothetical protein